LLLLGVLAVASLILAACDTATTPSQGESPLSTPTAGEPTAIVATSHTDSIMVPP